MHERASVNRDGIVHIPIHPANADRSEGMGGRREARRREEKRRGCKEKRKGTRRDEEKET